MKKKLNLRYELITIVVWLLSNLILFIKWDDIPSTIVTAAGFENKTAILKLVATGWIAYLIFFIFEIVIYYFDKKEYHQRLYMHMRCLNIETKFLAILTLSYVIICYAFGITILRLLVNIFEIIIIANMIYRIVKMIQERK